MKFGISYNLVVPRPLDNDQWGPEDEHKLMKEVLRTVPLKPAELKQLKVLAETSRAAEGIGRPLTLLLCPSVLARAAQEKSPKVNSKVVAGLARKLGPRA